MTVLEAHWILAVGSAQRGVSVAAGELGSGSWRHSSRRAPADRTPWRIATFWESRPVLEDYRSSIETPEGVVSFCFAATARKSGLERTPQVTACPHTIAT